MKLNLHIIFDELCSYKDKRIISGNEVYVSLFGVRYIQEKGGILSDKYLYLDDADIIKNLHSSKQVLHFIIIGNIEDAILTEQKWEAIILPKETNKNELFENMQLIFDKYNEWSEDTYQAISENASLQKIFNLCSLYLRNHIGLFDLSSKLILKTGIFPPNINNTVWEEVFENGYTTGDKFSTLQEEETAVSLFNSSNIPMIIENISTCSDKIHVGVRLFHDRIPFAYLASTNISGPFTTGQLSLIYF